MLAKTINSSLAHYKNLKDANLLFSYTGTLNGEIIAALLQLTDTKLKEMQASLRRKKNVINILIECLQNIYYHSSELSADNPAKECFLLVNREQDNLILSIGNYIANKSVDNFKSRLDSVNHLDKTQLHALYLETLNGGHISLKGGAGLGMLRMLRESGQPLEYDFERIDNQYSFFGLKIKVSLYN